MSYINVEARADLRKVHVSIGQIPLDGDTLKTIWGNVENDTAFVALQLDAPGIDKLIQALSLAKQAIVPGSFKERWDIA